MMIIVIRTY